MGQQFRHMAMMLLVFVVVAGTISGQETMQRAVFCRTDGRIEADGSAMRTAEWRNRIVTDFLRYAVAADMMEIDYCDTYRSLSMDDSTRISIDCVTFPKGDDTLAQWLDDIPENTYTEIDIPSKAPEKCIAFRKDSALVIVWCNLFAASDKVFDRVNEISGMNRPAIKRRKDSLILRDSLKWESNERYDIGTKRNRAE